MTLDFRRAFLRTKFKPEPATVSVPEAKPKVVFECLPPEPVPVKPAKPRSETRLKPVLVLRNRPGEEFVADFVAENDESVHTAFMSVLLPSRFYRSEIDELLRCLQFFWFTGKFALYACEMIREYCVARYRINLEVSSLEQDKEMEEAKERENQEEELCLAAYRTAKGRKRYSQDAVKPETDPAAALEAYACAKWKTPEIVAPLLHEISLECISRYLARFATEADKANDKSLTGFASRIALKRFRNFPNFAKEVLAPRIKNVILGTEPPAWTPAGENEHFEIPYLHEKKAGTEMKNENGGLP
jgi:hypothetical protein